MSRITSSMKFEAPPQQVWQVISDFEHAPDRIEAIVKMEILTDGPIGKGTRFRETRVMFKKEHSEEMEVIAWNPPRNYTLECRSCGCLYTSMVSSTPEGNGTRVEMSFEAKPLSFIARVMSGLTGWMMAGACRKAFEKDLADLKRVVEGGQHAVQTA